MSILNSFVNGMCKSSATSPPYLGRGADRLLQTSSSASPPRPPSLPPTTRSPPSRPERFRPRSVSSCRVSWPSTLFRRVPRLSPSTPHRPNKPAFSVSFLSIARSSCLGHGSAFRNGCHDGWQAGSPSLDCLLMRYGLACFFLWGHSSAMGFAAVQYLEAYGFKEQ